MTTECPFHQEFAGLEDFQIVRCCHIGERYVIESSLMDGTLLSVDYIETSGGQWQNLETATVWTVMDDRDLEAIYARAYDDFVERMRADDPPRGIRREDR